MWSAAKIHSQRIGRCMTFPDPESKGALNPEKAEQRVAYSIIDDVAGTVAALQRVLTSELTGGIEPIALRLADTLRAGNKILIMGNGGSAADAQHIAAELVGRYKIERRGLAAIALTTDTSVLTAWGNDYAYETVFSRQVEALAQPGDVVWGISTSGNSANVVRAFEAARAKGATTLGLLGRTGGKLAALSDLAFVVPLEQTDQIQTAHQIVYHAICAYLDHVFQPDA
jgi:D-sedoheptulose 7-phosphate isomerase